MLHCVYGCVCQYVEMLHHIYVCQYVEMCVCVSRYVFVFHLCVCVSVCRYIALYLCVGVSVLKCCTVFMCLGVSVCTNLHDIYVCYRCACKRAVKDRVG